MAGLNDDTVADKAFRFGLGLVLGVGVTWYQEAQGVVTLAVGLVTGLLALAFGNKFIEWFVRSRAGR